MMAQHPIPPEPPVIVPPNRDVPDPTDPLRRGPDRQLPPDSTPIPEQDPGTPVDKRDPPANPPHTEMV